MSRAIARTAAVPKARSLVYLRRAGNLFVMMEEAETTRNSDGVATNGIQAAISYSDAFTVFKRGLRSRSQDHQAAVRLIATVNTPAASTLTALVQGVLNRKSEVEYGDRDVTPDDAARIAKTVREIRALVESEVR